MANNIYDQNGNHLGTVKTQQEADSEALGAMLFLVAPFTPILWLAWKAGAALINGQNWHPLPAILIGLAIVGVCLFGLYRSIWIRYAYFGGLTLALTVLAFRWVAERSDTIWASAAAVIILLVGALLTFGAAKLDGLPR